MSVDFSWTPDQDDLYRRTFGFARERLNATVEARRNEHRFGTAEWRACGDFGLLGLSCPQEHGGMGLDALSTARAIEAFGRGCEDGGLVFSAAAHLFACVMPIVEHGETALKERVLPKLATGGWIGANAITEPEAGSDVFAMKSSVRRDGDEYVLNGVKSYVTNGPVADLFVVYATQNPAHGYLGISGFVVEADRPGVSVGEPFHKLGLTTSPISSLYLDDCRIPVGNRLGSEGKGAAIFTGSMLWERACLFAAYVGAMERQLETTIAYVKDRKQFRKPLGKHQAVAHRVADMKLRLEAARLLLYRACWQHDQGGDATLEIALSKLAISEAAIQSGLDAIQLHGGIGVISESGIEHGLRDAIPSAIFSGTSEIQRDLIASRLGL